MATPTFGRMAFFGLVFPLLLAISVACGSTETTTETLPSDDTTEGDVTGYPVTVTDMLGRSVEITEQPERIISISPTATETLYSLGGTAIARDSSSKFPAEVESLETVGGAYTPSVEAILSLTPDLILIEALSQGHMLEILAPTGAQIVAVRAASLEDVTQSLELLGKVTDRRDAATQAIDEINGRMDTAGSDGVAPSILILISDADRNLYAAKPESYPGAVAAIANTINVAEGLADAGPFPGFTLFSGEQAVAANPDFIFAITPAPEPAPRLSSVLGFVPGYSELSAVTGGRLYELDATLFLTAPGPRIVDALEELRHLLDEPS